MEVWPPDLPQAPAFGWSEQAGEDNVIRSANSGPAKMRRRYTAEPDPITWPSMMTGAQVASLKSFWETTVVGVLPFEITHPRTGATVTARFTQRPSWTQVSVDAYRVTVNLEVLPAPQWP